MRGALGLRRVRGVVGGRGGLDVAAREGRRGEAVAVVEALEDEVGGGVGEGVAQAAEDDGADGVVEAGAYLEKGEEVGCREGFEDEGEDLAWLAAVGKKVSECGPRWGGHPERPARRQAPPLESWNGQADLGKPLGLWNRGGGRK